MRKIAFLAVAALAVACSSPKHSTSSTGTQQTFSSTTADGSSYENAIVIQEKSETTGVSAEYKWLRENYPGYKSKGQALQTKNGKSYDVLTIVTADGTEKKVYFDILNFFGKF